jgi:hypothetical protein
VSQSTISRANENRDWRIFADFGDYLLKLVRPLYADCPVPTIDIDNEIFALDVAKSKKLYPEKLRLVEFHDHEKDNKLVFLTNSFEVSALEVAYLYKNRFCHISLCFATLPLTVCGLPFGRLAGCKLSIEADGKAGGKPSKPHFSPRLVPNRSLGAGMFNFTPFISYYNIY